MKDELRSVGLYEFLERLRCAGIHFTLATYRGDTIMVQISVPGERWEVEFFGDGTVDIERFRSDGQVSDRSALEILFTAFAETSNSAKKGSV